MEKSSAAQEYAKRGWKVIALHHVDAEGRCSCKLGAGCRSAGKHPLDTSWQEADDLSPMDLHAHFTEGEANVGLSTGRRSGFWVLDIDPDHGGHETLARLIREHGDLPATRTVETGSGGQHFYFALADGQEVRGTQGHLGAGIDTRGEGGQVVAPPSRSDKGVYKLASDAPLAVAPEWLSEALKPREVVVHERVAPPTSPDAWLKALLGGTAAQLREVGQSDAGWDAGTFKVAVRLAEVAKSDWNELTLEQAHSHLLEHAPTQAAPTAQWPTPWTLEDVEEKWQSGLRGSQPIPPPAVREDFPEFAAGEEWPTRTWDDLGNAMRLQDHYGRYLRYVPTDKEWAVYKGGRWVRRNSGLAGSLVPIMLGRLPTTEAMSYSDQPSGDDPSPREAFLKWVDKQRSEAKMTAALSAARRIPDLHTEVEEFDADPMLLNAPNGVLDLASGEWMEHQPEQLLTLQTAAPIDLGAACPRWEAFLERTQPDPQVREFLAEVVGYSLTGRMDEQAIFIHHGSGANGKSVFMDVLSSLLGGYSQVVPRQTLLVKRNDGIPTDIARMVGKRFLHTGETATGRQLDEEVVKSITGGDRQVARHLHADEFEFKPQGKLHYATNHLPHISDADSIWRRIILIRWGVVILEHERDGLLAEGILQEERAGALAWAIKGAQRWASRGRLVVPES